MKQETQVKETVADSPFAIFGKAMLTTLVCIVLGIAIGYGLILALTPLVGTLKAGSIAIPVALIGTLLAIQFCLKKYFIFPEDIKQ